MSKKSIYIADDEENIRVLIKSFLEKDYNIKTFCNGEDLYNDFLKKESDLVILDIMMAQTDGLTVCKNIRKKSNVPIIIVSAKDKEIDVVDGITIGADDYLVKPFSPLELVARIKSIFRRLDITPKINGTLNIEDLNLNTETRICTYKEDVINLTTLEFNFLCYLVQKQEAAVSRIELLKEVWQIDYECDTRVVDDTLKRLRKKISGTNIKITSIWGYGFKIEVSK